MDFVGKGIRMMNGFGSLKGKEEEANPVTATVEEMTSTDVTKGIVKDLAVVLTESRVVEE